MSSSTYPVPPPTSNTLAPAQRTHLVRTHRKLEAVLGTTPFVLEAIPAPVGPAALTLKISLSPARRTTTTTAQSPGKTAKRSRRQGSVFALPKWDETLSSWTSDTSSTGSSRSSCDSERSGYSSGTNASLVHLPSTSSSCTSSDDSDVPPLPRGFSLRGRSGTLKARLPPPLRLAVLTPRPLASQQNEEEDVLSYPRAPLSPLLSGRNPGSPITPTPERAIDARVRKLAKLHRTLGERPPPELVFPPSKSSSRSSEVTQAPAVSACPTPSLPRPTTTTTTVVTKTAPRRPSDLAHIHVSIERLTDPLLPPALSSFATKRTKRRSRSLSSVPIPTSPPAFGTHVDAAVAAARYAPLRAVQGGERDFPGVTEGYVGRGAEIEAVQGENGWVGEWNRGNMRQVRDGLRALRTR